MRRLGAAPPIPVLWPHASGRIAGLPAIGAEVAVAALLDISRGDLAARIKEDPVTGRAYALLPPTQPDRAVMCRALLLADLFDLTPDLWP